MKRGRNLEDNTLLIEPTCQASLIRHPGTGNRAGDVLLFSNPASISARTNGIVRLSRDEGRTWPISRVVYPASFGYSCLVSLDDKNIGCLFERGKRISFCRFSMEWLIAKEKTAIK